MPLIKTSDFKAPFYWSNRHLQTIYPALFRKVESVKYTRERFELPDGDFIDLDFSKIGSKDLVIVLHGLEGSTDRPYVKSIVKIFNKNGWDGLGINFRGCSGEQNRLARTYHSGETSDLDQVVNKIDSEGFYKRIAIVGFSLGGNVTLKYIGEQSGNLNSKVKAAVAFSVPAHLETASIELSKWHNMIYMRRFMDNLKEKIKEKEAIVQDLVDLKAVYKSKNFLDFDNCYTAPVHGFKDALDYWTRSSSKQFLSEVKIPVLLVNAWDDSFLSEECYPFEIAKSNPNFFLEVPKNGGHVGFVSSDQEGYYWSDRRALNFVIDSI